MGSGLAQRAVRPMVVVMAFVMAQQGRGMALVDDQDAVEEFAARVPTKRSAIGLAAVPAPVS